MSAISTHVLDIAAGPPGRWDAGPAGTRPAASRAGATSPATTDADGRIASLGPEGIAPGTYRLIFDTGGYTSALQRQQRDAAFFPEVAVTFAVRDLTDYHVPLLMSPFGYSTYRGS